MAKSKMAKKNEEVSNDSVRHSIPAMGERTAPSAAPSSVIDRHRRKFKPTSKPVKDSERPVIDIPQSTQSKFIDFACTKEVFDLVEKQKKTQQADVSSEIYESFVDALWRSKCQPANPNIEARTSSGKVDATGQFIVASGSKIKISMPEANDGEDPEDALVRGLVNAGVDPANAERLVSSEVSFVPSWTMSFTDMMRGEVKEGKINAPNPTAASAAEILFCAIQGEDTGGNPIDEKGRIELLKKISGDGWISLKSDIEKRTVYVPILVDSKDFLDRVCGYAESREELRSILAVFSPTHYCQRVVFAPNDSESSKKSRMVAEAKAVIG